MLVASLFTRKELWSIGLKNMVYWKKYLSNFLDLKIYSPISREVFNLLNSAFNFTVFVNK